MKISGWGQLRGNQLVLVENSQVAKTSIPCLSPAILLGCWWSDHVLYEI